jgi:hypothetical protein
VLRLKIRTILKDVNAEFLGYIYLSGLVLVRVWYDRGGTVGLVILFYFFNDCMI